MGKSEFLDAVSRVDAVFQGCDQSHSDVAGSRVDFLGLTGKKASGENGHMGGGEKIRSASAKACAGFTSPEMMSTELFGT